MLARQCHVEGSEKRVTKRRKIATPKMIICYETYNLRPSPVPPMLRW